CRIMRSRDAWRNRHATVTSDSAKAATSRGEMRMWGRISCSWSIDAWAGRAGRAADLVSSRLCVTNPLSARVASTVKSGTGGVSLEELQALSTDGQPATYVLSTRAL